MNFCCTMSIHKNSGSRTSIQSPDSIYEIWPHTRLGHHLKQVLMSNPVKCFDGRSTVGCRGDGRDIVVFLECLLYWSSMDGARLIGSDGRAATAFSLWSKTRATILRSAFSSEIGRMFRNSFVPHFIGNNTMMPSTNSLGTISIVLSSLKLSVGLLSNKDQYFT